MLMTFIATNEYILGPSRVLVWKGVHEYKRLPVDLKQKVFIAYVQCASSEQEARKMAFSIFLHLSILPALSATTLWQNTMKCRNAVTEFSQESTCFGSAAGQDAWLAIFTFNERSFATHLELHQNPLIITHVQGLINFYSSFCASQDCVNSYANLVEICFELNQDKVYI